MKFVSESKFNVPFCYNHINTKLTNIGEIAKINAQFEAIA
jgi:hypothetical protein